MAATNDVVASYTRVIEVSPLKGAISRWPRPAGSVRSAAGRAASEPSGPAEAEPKQSGEGDDPDPKRSVIRRIAYDLT